MNVEVSNHMQALEDDQIKTLDKKFRPQESNKNTKQNTQNNHQNKKTILKIITNRTTKVTRIKRQ